MKCMKRILILALSAVLLGAILCMPAAAADTRHLKTGVAFVTAGSLRLRAAPSTTSNTLAYASKDEVVVLLEKNDSWYKVIYNLQVGYMHSNYLDAKTVENVELGYGKVNYTKVNMRTGPGTGYSRIGQSSQNDACYIIGINKQWYKVIWNDQICYIRSDYLTLTEYPYENRASAKSPLFFRGGKSTGTPVSPFALKNPGNTAAAIIRTAKQYIGVPYVWAGTSPSGFDCSGLVYYVFKQHGISLNRTAKTQYQHGTFIPKGNLQPGDLVFFENTYTTGISHVGIYIGDGQFIHASSSKGVTISSLSNTYWAGHYYGARRVF